MQSRRTARALIAGLVAVAAAAAGGAQSAGAKTVEPLNRYAVSGKVNTDELARAGFDLIESRRPDGGFDLIATRQQARDLRDKGATVRQLTFDRSAQSTPATLTQPTRGYNVFRPWSLKPAPCPQTCSTPLVPLKKWYHDLASRYPEIVKEETIGHSILGQPIKAYKVTGRGRARRATAPSPSCSTSRPSTPASGSRPRSIAGCSSGTSTTGATAASRSCSARTRSGSSP